MASLNALMPSPVDPAGDAPSNPLLPQPNTVNTADAYTSTTNNLASWLQDQRAKSVAMGLWDPEKGIPTQAGLSDAMRQVAQNFEGGIKAYHGSPYSFDKFDLGKIGTGEGNQAYGHGLYFAEHEPVAEQYRNEMRWKGADFNDPQILAQNAIDKHRGDRSAAADTLQGALDSITNFYRGKVPPAQAEASKNTADAIALLRGSDPITGQPPTPGHMYEVNLNVEPNRLLDWDKPLGHQTSEIQDALFQMPELQPTLPKWQDASQTAVGGNVWASLAKELGPDKAKEAMQASGIPGIRYLDAGSRGAGEGTSNYVMFDPATIEILRKYGLLGMVGGGAAAAGTTTPPTE